MTLNLRYPIFVIVLTSMVAVAPIRQSSAEPVSTFYLAAGALNMLAAIMDLSRSGTDPVFGQVRRNNEMLVLLANRLEAQHELLLSIYGKVDHEEVKKALNSVFDSNHAKQLSASIRNIELALKSIKEQHATDKVENPDTLGKFQNQVDDFLQRVSVLNSGSADVVLHLIPTLYVLDALIAIRFANEPEILNIEREKHLTPIVSKLRSQLLPNPGTLMNRYLKQLKTAHELRVSMYDELSEDYQTQLEKGLTTTPTIREIGRSSGSIECEAGTITEYEEPTKTTLKLAKYLSHQEDEAKKQDRLKALYAMMLQTIQYHLFLRSSMAASSVLQDGFYLDMNATTLPGAAFVRYHPDEGSPLLLVEGMGKLVDFRALGKSENPLSYPVSEPVIRDLYVFSEREYYKIAAGPMYEEFRRMGNQHKRSAGQWSLVYQEQNGGHSTGTSRLQKLSDRASDLSEKIDKLEDNDTSERLRQEIKRLILDWQEYKLREEYPEYNFSRTELKANLKTNLDNTLELVTELGALQKDVEQRIKNLDYSRGLGGQGLTLERVLDILPDLEKKGIAEKVDFFPVEISADVENKPLMGENQRAVSAARKKYDSWVGKKMPVFNHVGKFLMRNKKSNRLSCRSGLRELNFWFRNYVASWKEIALDDLANLKYRKGEKLFVAEVKEAARHKILNSAEAGIPQRVQRLSDGSYPPYRDELDGHLETLREAWEDWRKNVEMEKADIWSFDRSVARSVANAETEKEQRDLCRKDRVPDYDCAKYIRLFQSNVLHSLNQVKKRLRLVRTSTDDDNPPQETWNLSARLGHELVGLSGLPYRSLSFSWYPYSLAE